MKEPSVEQIRRLRLHAHHLDAWYGEGDVCAAVGACGMQNSPPGAWEAALHARVSSCGAADAERLLSQERSLVQAWSFRGAPVVFPVAESDVFLSALVPQAGEPWLYTRGITLALDALGAKFDELLEVMRRVMPGLDTQVIISKVALDQVIANWMEPLLPACAREAWREPSMYGSPDKQTVGGAVVSFLLRPCALEGLVVFGARDGASPTFTSYRRWLGQALTPAADAPQRLVRKFLHCFGPATPALFASWLGCSGAQARRLWHTVADELVEVSVAGKRAFLLDADCERLFAPKPLEREVLLLAAHDPYLDQRDRAMLQPNVQRQRQLWRTVANPGAIVQHGEVVGTWTNKKQNGGLVVEATRWTDTVHKHDLRPLAQDYATFRNLDLVSFTA